LEHDGDLSADDVERAEKELDKLTHEKVSALEALLTHKEQELLEL
jgi:ribosome recycling factor